MLGGRPPAGEISMRRALALSLLTFLTASMVSADVSLVERRELRPRARGAAKSKPGRRARPAGRIAGFPGLVDAQGLQYFIDTNVTSSTTSSASGAASDATYTHAVSATTSAGGTVS